MVTRSGRALALLLCIAAAAHLPAQAPGAATNAVVYNATARPLRIEHATSISTLQAGAGLWTPLDVQISSDIASWTIENARSLCSPVGGMGDGGPLGHVVRARSPQGKQASCVPDAVFRCIGVGIDNHGLKLVRIDPLDCLVLATSSDDFVDTGLAQVRDSLKTGPRLP